MTMDPTEVYRTQSSLACILLNNLQMQRGPYEQASFVALPGISEDNYIDSKLKNAPTLNRKTYHIPKQKQGQKLKRDTTINQVTPKPVHIDNEKIGNSVIFAISEHQLYKTQFP